MSDEGKLEELACPWCGAKIVSDTRAAPYRLDHAVPVCGRFAAWAASRGLRNAGVSERDAETNEMLKEKPN